MEKKPRDFASTGLFLYSEAKDNHDLRIFMSNVRDYLRKRAERKENKQTAKNVGNLIIKHRMAIISRTILVTFFGAAWAPRSTYT